MLPHICQPFYLSLPFTSLYILKNEIRMWREMENINVEQLMIQFDWTEFPSMRQGPPLTKCAAIVMRWKEASEDVTDSSLFLDFVEQYFGFWKC